MNFSLDDAVPVLRATPGVLRAWLADLPGVWIRSNEGPETWSPFDIVGHLIHGERTDWIRSLRSIALPSFATLRASRWTSCSTPLRSSAPAT
jgi:hypothetical protein